MNQKKRNTSTEHLLYARNCLGFLHALPHLIFTTLCDKNNSQFLDEKNQVQRDYVTFSKSHN